MGRCQEEYPALPQGSDSAGLGRAAASLLQKWALEQEEQASQTSSTMVF